MRTVGILEGDRGLVDVLPVLANEDAAFLLADHDRHRLDAPVGLDQRLGGSLARGDGGLVDLHRGEGGRRSSRPRGVWPRRARCARASARPRRRCGQPLLPLRPASRRGLGRRRRGRLCGNWLATGGVVASVDVACVVVVRRCGGRAAACGLSALGRRRRRLPALRRRGGIELGNLDSAVLTSASALWTSSTAWRASVPAVCAAARAFLGSLARRRPCRRWRALSAPPRIRSG